MQKSVKMAQKNKNLDSMYEFQRDLARAILLLDKQVRRFEADLGWLIKIRRKLAAIFS